MFQLYIVTVKEIIGMACFKSKKNYRIMFDAYYAAGTHQIWIQQLQIHLRIAYTL